MKTICGTPVYVAPEVWKKKKLNFEKTDIFSFGVTVFVLVTGSFPFMKASTKDKYYILLYLNKIKEYMELINQKILVPVSEDFISFISCIVCYEPEKRLSIDEIKNHAWINGESPDTNDIQLEFQKRLNIIVKQSADKEAKIL